jgi:hypothetical protein
VFTFFVFVERALVLFTLFVFVRGVLVLFTLFVFVGGAHIRQEILQQTQIT